MCDTCTCTKRESGQVPSVRKERRKWLMVRQPTIYIYIYIAHHGSIKEEFTWLKWV